MAFALKDVRYTTRKNASGPAVLHPRLLRDRTLLPQIDVTIKHFESMLGRERREIDPEVLVHFFGDPKLARCIVASLAHSYRFRSYDLAEVVSPRARARLRRAGIGCAQDLRLALFDRLNEVAAGFLPSVDRASKLGELESRWLLRTGQLDRLIQLDQDEHAILERSGVVPRAADVAAQYNLDLLVSLLRHAESIELELQADDTHVARDLPPLAATCAADVTVRTRGPNLLVQVAGRADALGGWSRHGRRAAHLVLAVLQRAGSAAVGGEAVVTPRDRRTLLRLTPEILAALGAGGPPSEWSAEPDDFDLPALEEAVKLARSNETGWLVQRLPEPRAWQAGVLLPDLHVRVGPRARWSLCAVRGLEHGRRLAEVAAGAISGDPFVFVGAPSAVTPLAAAGAIVVATRRDDPAATAAGLRIALGAATKPANAA